MSKTGSILVAILILALGFVLGHFASRSAVAPEPAEAEPAAVVPPPEPRALGAAELATEVYAEILLAALRERDGADRLSGLAALLAAFGPDAAPAVPGVLEQRAVDIGGAEMNLLLRFWVQHDPQRAARWALFKSPLGYRTDLVLATMEPWARQDPEKARDQVAGLQLAGTETTVTAQIALVRGWADSGKPGLYEWIAAMPPSFDRQRCIRILARKRVQLDGVEATVRWAEGAETQDPSFRKELYDSVGRALAEADPRAAVAWCEAHCDGPADKRLRKTIAAHWGRHDGRAAMEWAATASPGRERTDAVVGAFEGWLAADREGLAEYVDGMDPQTVPEWFHPALDLLAVWRGKEDPLEGIAWAQAIPEPERRESTLVTVLRVWRATDAAPADEWMAQSGLSEATIARVLAPAARRRPPSAAELAAEQEAKRKAREAADAQADR